MANTPFKLKSGNTTPFKQMGSSPVRDNHTTKTEKKESSGMISEGIQLAKDWWDYSKPEYKGLPRMKDGGIVQNPERTKLSKRTSDLVKKVSGKIKSSDLINKISGKFPKVDPLDYLTKGGITGLSKISSKKK